MYKILIMCCKTNRNLWFQQSNHLSSIRFSWKIFSCRGASGMRSQRQAAEPGLDLIRWTARSHQGICRLCGCFCTGHFLNFVFFRLWIYKWSHKIWLRSDCVVYLCNYFRNKSVEFSSNKNHIPDTVPLDSLHHCNLTIRYKRSRVESAPHPWLDARSSSCISSMAKCISGRSIGNDTVIPKSRVDGLLLEHSES